MDKRLANNLEKDMQMYEPDRQVYQVNAALDHQRRIDELRNSRLKPKRGESTHFYLNSEGLKVFPDSYPISLC